MIKRLRPLYACILIACFVTSTLYPQDLRAGFFDEDALKTTGIIIGITFGVCLVVVLIAGTMKDLKGDEPDDLFSSLHLQPLPDGWQDPLRLIGVVSDPDPVPSPCVNKPFSYGALLHREEQARDRLLVDRISFRFGSNNLLSGIPREREETRVPPDPLTTAPEALGEGLPWIKKNLL